MPKNWKEVAASQTDTVLVEAIAGKKIVVTGLLIFCDSTATQVTLNSKPASGAGVAVSPPFPAGANGGCVLPPFDDQGWIETELGESLTVTTGTGSDVSIIYKYLYK